MEVRKLVKFTAEDQMLLGRSGYTSSHKYDVEKKTIGEEMIIKINLIQLDTDYCKTYPEEGAHIDLYERLISLGYSRGVFLNNKLIAIAICEPCNWNKTLFIWNYQVATDHKRTGVGQFLMKSLEELAKSAGFRAIGLETQNTNVPAINFYKKCGFELEGIDLSYYTNQDITDGEVAFFLRKKL